MEENSDEERKGTGSLRSGKFEVEADEEEERKGASGLEGEDIDGNDRAG